MPDEPALIADYVPAVRVTTIDGEVWINAADLAVWSGFGGTEAGRELADKVTEMARGAR